MHAFVEKDGESKQLPLAFVIMSCRTNPDYVEVFNALLDVLGPVEVEVFVVDFEAAAWRAIRTVFPGKPIKGCAFHWTRAIWKHVQEYGLVNTYRLRKGAYDYIRRLMALPFLPSAHIERTFAYLKGKANAPEMIRLMDYMDRQWFRSNPNFEVASWSVYQQNVRTNNDVEGLHHRLDNRAGMNDLGFYKLMPLLKREAALTEMAVLAGDLERNNRQRVRRKEVKLERLWTRYMDHGMFTAAFLRGCDNLYGDRI